MHGSQIMHRTADFYMSIPFTGSLAGSFTGAEGHYSDTNQTQFSQGADFALQF